jgi:hypothetical protein
MQIGRMVTHCVFAAAVAACAKTDRPAVMDDSTFVTAMAELHVIDRNYQLTEAARDSLRRAVLQAQGLTPEVLERQARHYAANPAHASAIWGAINAKTRVLTGDTARADLGRGQEQTR